MKCCFKLLWFLPVKWSSLVKLSFLLLWSWLMKYVLKVNKCFLVQCNLFTQCLTDPVYPGLFYNHLCHWLIDWFINSVSEPFPPNLLIIITTKPLELGSWNFERMFTPHHVSYVRCHMSGVRCQVSGVRCQVSGVRCQVSGVMCHMSGVMCQVSHLFFIYFFWTRWWS